MLPRALRHPSVLSPSPSDVLHELTGGRIGSGADAPDPAELGVDLVDVGSGQSAALPSADELLAFVHGWFGNVDVVEQTADTAAALAAAGYEPDAAVALRWDASLLRYGRAEARTEAVGEALAAMLERRASDADGGDGDRAVRLVGHSLGGRVVLETLRNLPADQSVATVATMGIAADGSTVARGGRWYDAIANRAGEVRNYHSRRDRVVGLAYGRGSETALGAEGAGRDAATPANYLDVDVTDSVPGHVDYPGNDAIARDLAAAIAAADAPADSTGENG